MKIKRFLFHISVSLVILAGGLLLIEYLQTGQIDGLKLIGLAAGLLLMGVLVILRGMDQTKSDHAGEDKDPVEEPVRSRSASQRQPARPKRKSARRKRR